MPQRGDAEEELIYKAGYHRNRLKLVAIDAILHRVSPETCNGYKVGLDQVDPFHCLREVNHTSPMEHCEALQRKQVHHLKHYHHEHFNGWVVSIEQTPLQ